MHFITEAFLEEDFILFATDDAGKTNGMTCGWGEEGILFNRHVISLYVRKSRYTYEFMNQASHYVIARVRDKKKLEYFGTVSGRDEDKMEVSGFVMEDLPDGRKSVSGAVECINLRKIAVVDLEHAAYLDEELAEKFKEKEDPHVLFIGEVIEPVSFVKGATYE
ncbi:MAG: hypothetical protein Q4Q17_03500 [Tissierellia bacterium]|nr:hypothetical protein [Tissierellia bacterium]